MIGGILLIVAVWSLLRVIVLLEEAVWFLEEIRDLILSQE